MMGLFSLLALLRRQRRLCERVNCGVRICGGLSQKMLIGHLMVFDRLKLSQPSFLERHDLVQLYRKFSFVFCAKIAR